MTSWDADYKWSVVLTTLECWSICQTKNLKMEEKILFLNSFRTRFSKF